jgi:hypothetical protein
MIALVDTVSPAKATPAVIESAAPTVIALTKKLTELVIVVVLAGYTPDGGWMT